MTYRKLLNHRFHHLLKSLNDVGMAVPKIRETRYKDSIYAVRQGMMAYNSNTICNSSLQSKIGLISGLITESDSNEAKVLTGLVGYMLMTINMHNCQLSCLSSLVGRSVAWGADGHGLKSHPRQPIFL